MMIIGICGTPGAGKDEVAGYFEKLGFSLHECSDIIRNECKKRGIPITLENMTKISNELRRDNGSDIFVRVIIERIKAINEKNAVVVGIRNVAEVESLRDYGNFSLVAVDADIHLRYERIQDRGREDDNISFEEFEKINNEQMQGDENHQQIGKVMKMADYTIINDESVESLKVKLEDLLDYLRNKND